MLTKRLTTSLHNHIFYILVILQIKPLHFKRQICHVTYLSSFIGFTSSSSSICICPPYKSYSSCSSLVLIDLARIVPPSNPHPIPASSALRIILRPFCTDGCRTCVVFH